MSGTQCIGCGRPLHSEAPMHQTKDGLMCDDCYFEAFGAEIEQHPIVDPTKHPSH